MDVIIKNVTEETHFYDSEVEELIIDGKVVNKYEMFQRHNYSISDDCKRTKEWSVKINDMTDLEMHVKPFVKHCYSEDKEVIEKYEYEIEQAFYEMLREEGVLVE